MATDPYAALGEGFSSGVTTAANLAVAKYKQQENIREQKKLEFDELRKNMQTYAEVLKSNAPEQLRTAAANGILGLYKKHAADIGLDPKTLPDSIKFDPEFSKSVAVQMLSLGKLYDNKITGKQDYLASMWHIANTYMDTVGKENPDIMKIALDTANAKPGQFSAIQGEERGMFQETTPGSG